MFLLAEISIGAAVCFFVVVSFMIALAIYAIFFAPDHSWAAKFGRVRATTEDKPHIGSGA